MAERPQHVGIGRVVSGVKVEVLEAGDWISIGDFEPDRASGLATLLRKEGKIARTDRDSLQRNRIGWVYDKTNQVWLGQVDGIDIFLATRSPDSPSWLLYVRLPGERLPYTAKKLADVKEAAEIRLDTFIRRMGVSIDE